MGVRQTVYAGFGIKLNTICSCRTEVQKVTRYNPETGLPYPVTTVTTFYKLDNGVEFASLSALLDYVDNELKLSHTYNKEFNDIYIGFFKEVDKVAFNLFDFLEEIKNKYSELLKLFNSLRAKSMEYVVYTYWC